MAQTYHISDLFAMLFHLGGSALVSLDREHKDRGEIRHREFSQVIPVLAPNMLSRLTSISQNHRGSPLSLLLGYRLVCEVGRRDANFLTTVNLRPSEAETTLDHFMMWSYLLKAPAKYFAMTNLASDMLVEISLTWRNLKADSRIDSTPYGLDSLRASNHKRT